MDSPMKQAAKLMEAKKGDNRKLALFLCLALLVTAGTVTAFVLHAQAQNHTRRVLTCAYEVHEHTEDCYPGGDVHADPICGLADFVVHTHNDDCYDELGELVCDLEEIEEHKHDEDCYTAPLTCELKEGPGHTHTAAECYAPAESAVPVCGVEEREATPGVPGHVHTAECYTAGEPQLACGLAEGEGAVEGSAGHSHGEDCYNEDGELACGLAEGEGAVEAVPGHTHSDACYETPSVLSCGIEEGAGAVEADPGHTHTGECYAEEELELTCTTEEYEPHTHTGECYGAPELTCEKKEIILHTHSEEDGCYAELTEDEKKLDPVPEHGALICEDLQIEEHTHNELCFTTETLTAEEVAELEHEAQPKVEDLQLVYEDENVRVIVDYDTNARLPGEGMGIALIGADTPAPELALSQMAVLTEAEKDDEDETEPAGESDPADETETAGGEPTEGEEETETPAPEDETPETEAPETETPAAPETGDTENTEDAPQDEVVFDLVRAGLVDEDGREWLPAATVTYTVQYLLDGELAGDPVQYHYTPGGMLPCFLRSIETFTQTVETDEFIVTARYTALAQLGDAVLYAAPITDEEAVADYTAQYREAVNSSRAQMHALMDIGFALNGEEIQPAAPVEITVQLKGEDGLPAGEPLTVVHFGAEGNDVIAAKADEAGAAAFKMDSFSPVGIGQTPESDDEGRALLDEQNGTFTWIDPDGMYHITFRVNGVIAPKTETPEDGEQAAAVPEEGEDAAAPEEGEDAGAPEEEAAAGEDEDDGAEEAAAPEIDTTDIPMATAGLLNFNVELLGEEDEAYAMYAAAAQQRQNALRMTVIRYSLTYGETEMDLSNCEITATIVPTMQLQAMSEAYAEENPVDNGDDDGDGYVLAADEESLLPAPEVNANLVLTVSTPGTGAGQLVEVQESIQLDGANAVPAQTPAADETETDAAPNTGETADADPTSVILNSAPAVATLGASPAAGDPVASALGGRAVSRNVFLAAELPATDSVQQAAAAGMLSTQQMDVNLNPESDTLEIEQDGTLNPTFTVQYYAYLNVMATTQPKGTTELTLIDTSGGTLPVNGGGTNSKPTGSFQHIYVDNKTGKVKTVEELTEVYSSKDFNFYRAPELLYTNALILNDGYALKITKDGKEFYTELWLQEAGGNAESTDKKDWIVYQLYGDKPEEVTVNGVTYMRVTYLGYDAKGNRVELSFTNNAENTVPYKEGGITYIPLNTFKTIRWAYRVNTLDRGVDANFYDYDISTGRVHRALPPDNKPNQYVYKTAGETFSGDSLTDDVLTFAAGLDGWDGHLYAYTKEQGINSSGNYSGSGVKLAFGNVNTGTNLGKLYWGSNQLNKYNNNSYQGCTFGLVTGLDSNGFLVYADGIQAPNLFGESGATGKTAYDDPDKKDKYYPLAFRREGDTYTLTAVNGTGATDLDQFNRPANSTGTHNSIWTNNFWPMDSAPSFGTGTHDVKFGGTATFKGGAHEIRFGPITQKDQDYTFPESDDGLYHNSYFGMHFEVGFELDGRYVGPLEYYFFGDDDMWVFLDGKLVCDIGGVHSSVGEYVNLWDYLEKGEAGSHTLSFYYTERGASGSTCWMQFTLPNVTNKDPGKPVEEYGTLQIGKTVTRYLHDGLSGEQVKPEKYDNGERFTFSVNFTNNEGKDLPHTFRCAIYKVNDKGEDELVNDRYVITNGNIFTLEHNEYIVIYGLPHGTHYEITEKGAEAKAGQIASNYTYMTEITIDGNRVSENDLVAWGAKVAEGDIAGNQTVTVQYNNKYHAYALPETGGMPAIVYTGAGAMLVMLAAAAYTLRKRRAKAAGSSAK